MPLPTTSANPAGRQVHTVGITNTSSTTTRAIAASFIKVYFGDGECVLLSRQSSTSGFQSALADLATQVSRRATGHPQEGKANPSALAAMEAVLRGVESNKSSCGAKKVLEKLRRLSNSIYVGRTRSGSVAFVEKQKEGQAAATAAMATSLAPPSTFTVGHTLVRDTPVSYRGAELLPLSFALDVMKNSRVVALYKKHLQLQQQSMGMLDSTDKCNNNGGGNGEVKSVGEEQVTGAGQNSSTAKETQGLSQSKGNTVSAKTTAPAESDVPRSAAPAAKTLADAWAAGQRRAQLWSALSSTIPFFGVLTMPGHLTVELLMRTSASATETANTGPGILNNNNKAAFPFFNAPTSHTAAVSCEGEYILLGCRERPRCEGAAKVASTFNTAALITPNTPNDTTAAAQQQQQPVSRTESNHDAYSTLHTAAQDRFIEQTRVTSSLRLPPLCSKAAAQDLDTRSTASLTGSANSSFASTSTSASTLSKQHHQSKKRKERQRVIFLEPLPERCVPPPPLPKTVVVSYGAPHLVTRPASPLRKSNTILKQKRDCAVSRPAGTQLKSEDKEQNTTTAATAMNRAPLSQLGSTDNTGADVSAKRCLSPILARSAVTANKGSNCSLSSIYTKNNDHNDNNVNIGETVVGTTTKNVPSPHIVVPLSAAAVARLTQTPQFEAHAADCAVSIGQSKSDKTNGAVTTKRADQYSSISGNNSSASEFCDVFDGFDVLWRGQNGEEAVLQWILDEYAAMLNQRM